LVIEKIYPKFWFTSETPLTSFEGDFLPLRPVTHNPSRKQFFSKLLGAVAALSLFPKLFAKVPAVTGVASDSNSSTSTAQPVQVRPDVRAVARRADTV